MAGGAHASVRDDTTVRTGRHRQRAGNDPQVERTGQRTEALFCRSLAQRAAGKGTNADVGLREVVSAPTVDLIESQIARELLAGNERRLPGPLPSAAP